MAETYRVRGKLDHSVSTRRKSDAYRQLYVSFEFSKYGNTLFCPVLRFQFSYGFPMVLTFAVRAVGELRSNIIKNLLCLFFILKCLTRGILSTPGRVVH